ncbi:MAG: hypothetical protein HY814_06035 [Candidatus Riflebacteria bacterium]|nr:hypothetical protein [Candidatus Riflebacteria bacterium]
MTSQETPLTTRTWRQDSGIDCTSCHVLRNAARGPHELDGAHRTVQDVRFSDRRACQQCHASTVREQLEGPSTKLRDRTCQQCHMPKLPRHLAVGLYQVLRKRKKSTDHSFDLAALLRSAATLDWKYDDSHRLLSVVVRNVGSPHFLPTGKHGAPVVRLVVYLESDERGKVPVKRTMEFCNKNGTAIGPAGTGTFELPLASIVPARYSVHARLLFLANEDSLEAEAPVMAQADFAVDYVPPAPAEE